MMYLCNAFSFGMVRAPVGTEFKPTIRWISLEEARGLAPRCINAVGHADTAALFAALLGIPLTDKRSSVTLKSGDQILVGQQDGPRLPAGATSLPEGARIDWALYTHP